jgi:hypothetical protein
VQRTALSVLVAMWITPVANAQGDLMLTRHDIPWTGGAAAVCPFPVYVSSTTPEPVVLAAWQLRFKIIPDSRAKGEVLFGAVSANSQLFEMDELYTDPNPPTSSDTSIAVAAYALDATVASIPQDDVKLLEIGLKISADAAGTFGIAVLPSSLSEDEYDGAEWYSDDPDFVRRPFVGLPFDAEQPYDDCSIYIGYVSIGAVPESASALLLLSGTITLVIFWFGRRVGLWWPVQRGAGV